MAASVQYRQQERGLGMVMKEKDDDLAMFLEMRNREKERDDFSLLQNSDEFDDRSGSKPQNPSISKMASTIPGQKPHANDFLNSDNSKTDYDWLLTPPGTPLFPSLEMESQKTLMSQIGISNGRPIAPKSRLANPPTESAYRSDVTSRRPASSTAINSSTAGIRRPSPSGRATATASRPSTTTTKPSRPSTPTSRATLLSTKPKAPPKLSSTQTRPTARSSTPTARSSTPTARPSMMTAPKSTSRTATPTRRSSTPSSTAALTKSGATMLKNHVPSRGTSPTVKSRPLKTSEMRGFSNDAPPNLRTSLPQRPASTSRGRPNAPIENSSNGRQRRQSCSPSRGLTRNGNVYNNGRTVLERSRGHPNSSDDVNPVLMGTQMVERVVNMRKLAPPKQDDHLSNHNNSSGKSSSSQDNSGFGRTLSKKSFDMALRHMDIRRSIPGNLRPLMTKIPASSVYSVRSGSTKSRTDSVSDSPLATSSNASSEFSFNNFSHCLDGSEAADNDLGSERG